LAHRRLARGTAAVRLERIDPVHQPDQDPGIHGGRKPAVSTPIKDVATLYGDVVRIAQTPDEFVAACVAALEESPSDRRKRVSAMQATVARSSWVGTAAAIHAAIEDALAESTRRSGEEGKAEQLA
jgi:hypothetical protein